MRITDSILIRIRPHLVVLAAQEALIKIQEVAAAQVQM